MIAAIIIIAILIAAFLKYRKVSVKEYELKYKVQKPFYQVSIAIIEAIFNKKMGQVKKSILKPRVMEHLKQINPTQRSLTPIKKYYVEKVVFSLCIIFAGSIVTILACLSNGDKNILVEDKYIERGSYQQGEQTKQLKVSVGEEIKEQEIKINVNEQQMSEEEVFDMFGKVAVEINNKLMETDASMKEIRKDIKLPSKIEGYPAAIEWETDNFEVLGSDGRIENEALEEEGVVVTLTATIHYLGYQETCEIPVKVLPPVLSEAEKVIKNLQDKIQQSNESGLTKRYVELPVNIDGKEVVWSEANENMGKFLWIFGIIVSILIYYTKDKELEKKVKKRNQQLLADYPDIVSKLTLLLGAGMTVKGAWQKVVLDYRETKEVTPGYYRYSYEEMLISYYEMIGGVSESKAYEEFGKRTKDKRYIRLSALITQNLRKGSRGLSKILESESLEAFEDRKAYAKIIGEEAGTKLMIPMFLNLILVLIIIMIPACMSF